MSDKAEGGNGPDANPGLVAAAALTVGKSFLCRLLPAAACPRVAAGSCFSHL